MTLLTFWQLSHLFAPFFTHYFRKESQIAESIKKQLNLGLGNLYLGCFNGICVQAQWRWSFWLSYFYAWWELGINNPSFHSVVYNCNHTHTHANKEFYNSCYLRRCVCVKLVTNGDRDGHVLKDIILFQILVQLMRSCSAILYSLN